MNNTQGWIKGEQADNLAKTIVDVVREPLIILDEKLNILGWNKNFSVKFKTDAPIGGKLSIFELNNGLFDVQPLRGKLEELRISGATVNNLPVKLNLGNQEKTQFLINSSKTNSPEGRGIILLSFKRRKKILATCK